MTLQMALSKYWLQLLGSAAVMLGMKHAARGVHFKCHRSRLYLNRVDIIIENRCRSIERIAAG
jgi:hypothetical protein